MGVQEGAGGRVREARVQEKEVKGLSTEEEGGGGGGADSGSCRNGSRERNASFFSCCLLGGGSRCCHQHNLPFGVTRCERPQQGTCIGKGSMDIFSYCPSLLQRELKDFRKR